MAPRDLPDDAPLLDDANRHSVEEELDRILATVIDASTGRVSIDEARVLLAD